MKADHYDSGDLAIYSAEQFLAINGISRQIFIFQSVDNAVVVMCQPVLMMNAVTTWDISGTSVLP